MWGQFYPNAWLGILGFSEEAGGEEVDAGEARHATPPLNLTAFYSSRYTLTSSHYSKTIRGSPVLSLYKNPLYQLGLWSQVTETQFKLA